MKGSESIAPYANYLDYLRTGRQNELKSELEKFYEKQKKQENILEDMEGTYHTYKNLLDITQKTKKIIKNDIVATLLTQLDDDSDARILETLQKYKANNIGNKTLGYQKQVHMLDTDLTTEERKNHIINDTIAVIRYISTIPTDNQNLMFDRLIPVYQSIMGKFSSQEQCVLAHIAELSSLDLNYVDPQTLAKATKEKANKITAIISQIKKKNPTLLDIQYGTYRFNEQKWKFFTNFLLEKPI